MAVFRLVHTADVHLDTCFAGTGMPPATANRRRQSLRDVFASIVRHGVERSADALLIAGDLFEQERVTRDTVAFLHQTFEEAAPLPILIAAGNHDPCTPDSPYVTESWPPNVTIFREPVWQQQVLAGDGLVVHGFGFNAYHIDRAPFGALEAPGDGRVHVAVAHGSERGHQPPEQKAYAPFDAADAAADGLAYLALGHFHGHTAIEGDFQTVMRYPGAPEGLGFRGRGGHCFLEVEIGDEGVRVTPVPSARAVYLTRAVDCAGLASVQQLVEVLRAIPGETEGVRQVLARVRLTGECPASLRAELPSAYDAVAEAFEFLDLRDETVSEEDYEGIAQEQTSLGAFVRRVNAQIDDEPGEDRRRMLERAREVGVAAYRDRQLAIAGLERS